MAGRGKRGKPNGGFPRFPPPLEIAHRAISTFPQRRRRLPSPITKEEEERLAPRGARQGLLPNPSPIHSPQLGAAPAGFPYPALPTKRTGELAFRVA